MKDLVPRRARPLVRCVTALAGLAVVLQGCTAVHSVEVQGRSNEANWGLSEINERASTRRARLFLGDGRRLTAGGLRVETDSTSWIADGRYETVATSAVTRVQFVERGRGALEGLGLGLLSGAVVGGVIGFVSYNGPDFLAGSRGESAVVGAGLLSYLTTPLGLLLGVAEGHREVYDLRNATAD